MLLYGGHAVSRSAETVEDKQTIGAVADPLKQLCETDPTIRARVGQACDAAAEAVSAAPERGADGRRGAAGVAGPPGIGGVAGTDGRNGIDGANGDDGQNGIDGETVVGPSGAPGVDGATPPCFFEAAQCRGADGRNGDPGAPGRDAELPTSYTKNYSDGTSETCTRSGGTDTAPVWDCTRA